MAPNSNLDFFFQNEIIYFKVKFAKKKNIFIQNLNRKVMGALVMLEKMLNEHNGNVPRDVVLKMYDSLGLNPVEGDEAINKFIMDMRTKEVHF